MRTIREPRDTQPRANAPVLVLVALVLQVACAGEVLAAGSQGPVTHERSVLRRVSEAVSRVVMRIAAPAEARNRSAIDGPHHAVRPPAVPPPTGVLGVRHDIRVVPMLIDLPPPTLA